MSIQYETWTSPIQHPAEVVVDWRRYAMQHEPAVLSKREREVFWLCAAGRTNKQIAHELRVSARTAEATRTNLKSKIPGLRTVDFGLLAYLILADTHAKMLKFAEQTRTLSVNGVGTMPTSAETARELATAHARTPTFRRNK